MTESTSPDTPRPSFLRTFLVYGTGAAIQRLASLLLFPVYTRFLTPEDYGALSLLGAFANFAHLFLGGGVPTSVFRFYTREETEEGRREALRACLNLVALAIIPTALLMSFSGQIAGQLLDDPGRGILVVLILISSYGDILSKVPLAPIRARQQSGLYVLLTMISLGATLTLSVTFVVALRWGVFGILLAQAMVTGSWALVLLIHLLRQGLPHAQPGLMRKIGLWGLPIVIASLAQVTLNVADRFLLKLFQPLSQVGLYAVGYRLSEGITMATTVFQFAWTPFAFEEAGREGGKTRMAGVASTWFGLIALAAVAVAAFAREALWVLTHPDYYAAATVVPLAVTGLAFWALYPITSMGFQLVDRTARLSYLTAIAAALNLLLNVFWIPRYGIIGAAAATAIAFAVLFGLTLAFSQRYFPLPLPLYRWGAAIVLALAAGWLALQAEVLNPIPAVLLKVAILIALFGAYAALGLAGITRLRAVAQSITSRMRGQGR